MKIFCRSLVVLLCMFVTAGCSDLLDPTNADSSTNSGGYLSVYDILEERGNFSIFLEAVDLTSFAKIMQGSGLVTVFAPEDADFGPYIMGKYGVTDVSLIPEDELSILVGFHMVQYSYRPSDLLAFSMSGSAVIPEEGDGSCYRFLTLATSPVERVTNMYGYSFDVYSHNKYLPIISTRFMENRELADMQSDYELLFPDVWWKGEDDQIYVGDAAIVESGITAINGYLYILDAVAEPLNTIYDELDEDWAVEYSLFNELCKRVDYFEYSSSYTDVYASYGDSLYLHMSWTAAASGEDGDEIAELGSEWTYHYTDVYDRAMKYTVHCFAPTNRFLETFLVNNFGEYFADGNYDYVSQLPVNVIYHLLRTFVFDKRELIFPSELTGGFVGNNGEVHYIAADAIQDIQMCSNGVIYGIDTIITSSVYNSVIQPIMTDPDYQYYANAITSDETYIMVASESNDYTFFVRTDDVVYESDKRFIDLGDIDPISPVFGEFNFKYGSSISAEDEDDVSLMVKNNMVYGNLEGVTPVTDGGFTFGETPDDTDRVRYYRTIGYSTDVRYLYTLNGLIYDQYDTKLNILETYTGYNGTVYEVDRELVLQDENEYGEAIVEASYATALAANPNLTIFTALMSKAGVSAGSFSSSMLFAPIDSCLTIQINEGNIPGVSIIESSMYTGFVDSLVYEDTQGDARWVEELEYFVRYHFASTVTNDLPTYLLPSLGNNGVTSDDPYEVRLISSIPYYSESEIEQFTVSWSVDDPNVLVMTDNSNTSYSTLFDDTYNRITITSNGVLYVLDGCFNYNKMFEFKQ